MRKIVTLMLALGGLSVGCADEQTDEQTSDPQAQLLDAGSPVVCAPGADGGAATAKSAGAKIAPRSGNTTLAGTIVFKKSGDTVTATLEVTGAPPGQHGAHLHAKGDCSAADGTSAGDHWNPTAGTHGAPSATAHLGDLGNLTVAADGTGTLALSKADWAIGDGSPNDVVGKAIVIHGGPDDLATQPSGNSGPRIGCGVVAAN